MPDQPGRRRVAIPVLEDSPLFELAVPCEVFGRDRLDLTPQWYDLTLCHTTNATQSSLNGLWLTAPQGPHAMRDADLIVVPACLTPAYEPPAALLDALREAHDRGTRIAALCSGAFVLAAAGLLDGREATTHWMHAEELRRRYPRVRVRERALYIDEGSILTSAGTAAGIDLCLHIVRRDFGSAVAAEVGRRMVIAPHRQGDQAQYAPLPASGPIRADELAPVLDWAVQRLHQPLTIGRLAERAAMSTRTFGRRFARQVGMTPLKWLTQQRLAAARELLETTNLPIDAIAKRTGFNTGDVLRQHFHRHIGTTPTAYRRSFSAPHPPEAARPDDVQRVSRGRR
ncbi:GlxA family transcriptional regulator [Actinomadura rubrisoli]|uniref:Helix-turn-helix domain-containing protein n=1 Tax=Actinomadura rubrisoli TaxID=2530368 RepID=A0A4R5BW77_9ACTN|nr:helix-turn-helix domain-containing protein [Actinomadura rubrisoli]TDD90399.1 helix-turn-helix domain-containing protein [Actinomadura rubrisoli]